MPAYSAAGGELPGAMLVHWRPTSTTFGPVSYSDALALPLDAATGIEMDGRSPITLGNVPQTSVSPDGRFLAVTSRGTDEVKLYDLRAWQLVATMKAVPGLVVESWSSDGSQLFAWRDYCPQPASEGRCLAAWERELRQMDVVQASARRIADFDFSIVKIHVGPSSEGVSERAYALGIRTNICCGIDPQGDPFVAVVDLAKGEVIKEIQLRDMLIGQPRHWLGDTSMYASYWPATAMSQDGSKLYVADSVDFRVTVVDLNELRIERTVDLKEPRSRLARIGGWLWSQFVSTAEAKGGPSYRRIAELTPDSRYLLISGSVTLEEIKDNERSLKDRPAGLVVIDTEKMSVVFREGTTSVFDLSPDGRWLLAYGSYWDESRADDKGFGGLVAFGLKLIDLQSFEVVRHFWPNEEARVAAISSDSKYAYITTDGPGMAEWRRAGINCTADCTLLNVLEMSSGELVSQLPLGEMEGIISLAPDQ
ncbi:MAG: hypothetical protein GEU75_10585 [Dehalococcoidia bacterium]|nr:hypothetical protein [Dehalococcoidia bacterium]